jgi:hypothetical protein
VPGRQLHLGIGMLQPSMLQQSKLRRSARRAPVPRSGYIKVWPKTSREQTESIESPWISIRNNMHDKGVMFQRLPQPVLLARPSPQQTFLLCLGRGTGLPRGGLMIIDSTTAGTSCHNPASIPATHFVPLLCPPRLLLPVRG